MELLTILIFMERVAHAEGVLVARAKSLRHAQPGCPKGTKEAYVCIQGSGRDRGQESRGLVG